MPAQAETEVDLALVLAVDVSFSMDPEEQALQREGFTDAFRSDLVQDAIRRGTLGRIAVIYMEWAGASDQKVIMPWTIVDGARARRPFPTSSPAWRRGGPPGPRSRARWIFGRIAGGVQPLRQVIDVSDDGANNQGRSVTAARDEAVAKGITINGLPIMLKAPGYFDIADLDLYYRDCVIGGQGAFMVPARSREKFRDAIKTKIIMELDDSPAVGYLIQPAQASRPTNCFAGESQWRGTAWATRPDRMSTFVGDEDLAIALGRDHAADR